jgi:acetyl esterase/lipase
MESSAHRQIRSKLQEMKQAPPGDIEAARAALDALLGRYPLPEGTSVETVEAGGVPGEWVSAPDVDPDRTILYLHGGAYTRGSIVSHRALVARLSAASGARALVIAYRLAPENPFPAAVEDATAAYRWLLEQHIQPDQLVVSGDSAGGGLSLALLLALRDAGHPLPAGAALLSPWTDLAGTGESIRTLAGADPWLNAERLMLTAGLYLAGADACNPLASPLYGDLHGLPPLLIQVGTDEILLDDATRLAERARAAGVPVTLEVWERMWHVFQSFAAEIPEGRQAVEKIGAFVRQVTQARSPASLPH